MNRPYEYLELIIKQAQLMKVSDIHLQADMPPVMRCNGLIEPLEGFGITDNNLLLKIVNELLIDAELEILKVRGDVDIGRKISAINCRINIFRTCKSLAIACRILPNNIPTMDSINLPLPVQKLIHETHGLIIVSGPTGAGKSTTLAAMLEAINESRKARIITIENPIEYHHKSKLSLIAQREIGEDCVSFADGLSAALREDPNIIMIGEIRDAESVNTALTAAETGHLVLTTLHTANVVESIDRLVQYFPPANHSQIRNEIANSFRAIISQKLFLTNQGDRTAAFEVLLSTDAVRNVIRRGENHRLYDYMHPTQGMQTMEQAITGLQNRHLIS